MVYEALAKVSLQAPVKGSAGILENMPVKNDGSFMHVTAVRRQWMARDSSTSGAAYAAPAVAFFPKPESKDSGVTLRCLAAAVPGL